VLQGREIQTAAAEAGAAAHRAMLLELYTHPKPGLVSHVDCGSHGDMDVKTFEASAAAIRPFMSALSAAGSRLAPMATLREIGIAAEAAMMRATGGVNTHRGAISGLGLLCAASGARTAGLRDGCLGDIVGELWGPAIACHPVIPDSHGTAVLHRHGAGGARHEAISGFATVYATGLPALRVGQRMAGRDAAAARLHCFFSLLATVGDTALLHRGGSQGLQFAQGAARAFLAAGSVAAAGWQARAQSLHRQFVSRHLSPGGCADLLAMTLFAATMGDDTLDDAERAA